jgi:hexokinase
MSDDQPPPMQAGIVKSLGLILPLSIAVLSLLSSIFQSWNYSRNIESAQRNILRSENLRSCKDIIDVYFQFRLKTEETNRLAVIARAAGKSSNDMATIEIKALVYKFGALGTFLANFREKEARVTYTELTWRLNELAEKADSISAEEFTRLFNEIDARFVSFNQDCVRAAQGHLL